MAAAASVVVFDVNETLSDMSPMAQRFADAGAPTHLAKQWFAALLRDGFALAATGDSAGFAEVGAGILAPLLDTAGVAEPGRPRGASRDRSATSRCTRMWPTPSARSVRPGTAS
ncbi:hypothetical protein [Sinomonas atrocyanea]